MTPGEVKGLQSIAMAHGGSLTVNPETGLPEAGFLKSILPMIAGFALGPAGLGMTAMNAGLASAAIGTALTGDLKQGIMAGLGAYGGAGLGTGLMAQGAQGAAGAVDDVALASKNAAANSQIGNTMGGTTAQAQVFGQPAVNATNAANAATPNMGLSAYTPPKPLYPDVNFATGMNPPGKMFNAADIAARNSQIAGHIPPNMTDPNAFVTTNVPPVSTNAYNQGLLAPDNAGFTQYKNAAQLTPKPISTYAQPDRLAQYKGVDFTKGAQYNPPASTTTTMADASSQGISRPFSDRMSQLGRGVSASTKDFEGLKGLYNAMPTGSVIASGITLADAMKPEDLEPKKDDSLIRPYEFSYGANASGEPYSGSAERTYFNPVFTAKTPYRAPGPEYAAEGGLMGYAVGGPVEQMAAMNAVGANTGYPQAGLQTPMYSNPAMQRPQATNVIAPSADAGVGTYTGEPRFAAGGISTLGGYSDGGRLLKGPGDGVSDSIPASIGNRQPARLADGEFVVPARIVSEIGNGSTEAGARKLYAMMDRVQKARRKTVGKNQVARNTKAEKLLPA
jgi:hypothetical protein